MKTRLSILFVAAVFIVVGVAQTFNSPSVQAVDYDQKIRELQAQVDSFNSRAKELAAQADTLNNKIAELQNQQAQIQVEINLNNAKRDELTQQIADNEAKLRAQSEALGKTLADIYYSQKTSTLDILLNSNSVSDYVDKASRQSSMKDGLTNSVNEINALKKRLNEQKTEVEDLLAQQQAQKNMLADNQKEQQQILDQTKGQEATYQQMIADSQKKIQEFRRIQEELARSNNANFYGGDGSKGGYPLDGLGRSSGFNPNGCLYYSAPWGGTCARQCVSYVEWKVYQLTGIKASGSGNANRWHITFSSRDRSAPRANSVAYWTRGTYGHVAWVEAVGTNPKSGRPGVYVSQYNADWNGNYSEGWVDVSQYDGFLYF